MQHLYNIGNKSAIKFLQDYITFSYTILNKIISIFHDYNKYTFTFGIVLFASLQYDYELVWFFFQLINLFNTELEGWNVSKTSDKCSIEWLVSFMLNRKRLDALTKKYNWYIHLLILYVVINVHKLNSEWIHFFVHKER